MNLSVYFSHGSGVSRQAYKSHHFPLRRSPRITLSCKWLQLATRNDSSRDVAKHYWTVFVYCGVPMPLKRLSGSQTCMRRPGCLACG
jgi:hypothetical protein